MQLTAGATSRSTARRRSPAASIATRPRSARRGQSRASAPGTRASCVPIVGRAATSAGSPARAAREGCPRSGSSRRCSLQPRRRPPPPPPRRARTGRRTAGRGRGRASASATASTCMPSAGARATCAGRPLPPSGLRTLRRRGPSRRTRSRPQSRRRSSVGTWRLSAPQAPPRSPRWLGPRRAWRRAPSRAGTATRAVLTGPRRASAPATKASCAPTAL
mmetsp:Transcript_27041/g.68583  ORF Transcript_27041/g.68583 Transcript_27041/m.68583 type:complete len:219 (-) Transcript_27041:222-878(-)